MAILKASTFGVGELIKDAIYRGSRDFIVGLGGSATNDAGLGMLRALGFKFLDNQKNEVVFPKDLDKIVAIDKTYVLKELEKCNFKIACDVNNPLYGKNGATYVYGKQKGASTEVLDHLENQLKAFADIVDDGLKYSKQAGSGAAGGLGFGFLAFLNAELKSGIDIVLEAVNFKEKIKDADFVITGEGKIDTQSAMGKVISGIGSLCKKQGVPCIALSGNTEDTDSSLHEIGITSYFSILNSPMSLYDAMNKDRTLKLIEKEVEQIFRLINY